MVDLPSTGQANWDVPLNTALAELAHSGFTPAELGIVAWNYDSLQCNSGTLTRPATGTVVMIRMPRLTEETEITAVRIGVADVATTPTAARNYAGLYDSTGARVGVSAEIGSMLTTAGLKYIPLTSAYVAAPGTYYVALVQAAATTAGLYACANTNVSMANALLPAALARFAHGPTGQTSLPASITMASRTPVSEAYWAAIS